MNIVSTAKIRRDLQEDLINAFPRETFIFHNNIEDAGKDLQTAEICITYGEDFTEDIVARCAELKWIMVISAGVDQMPMQKIKEKGILMTNAKGIHKIPMAEYTMAMILQYMKDLTIFNERQRNKEWNRSVNISELAGKTLTVIGPGAIGTEIARLAKAFRMKTQGISRSGQPAGYIDKIYSTEHLLDGVKESDIVVSVLPSTEETAGLIDHKVFETMKPCSLFVNIGRGMTVVQQDLEHALRSGAIHHAILDVFEEEPLPKEHPFWEMKNVTITPHVSSITSEYQPRSLEIFKTNLDKYINNQDDFQNKIDPDRGY